MLLRGGWSARRFPLSLLPSQPAQPPARPGRPLRQRLVLLMATGLLPVSLLGAWGVWTAVQGQLSDLERSTVELSRAIASTVESELDATLRTLEAMSRSPALAEGDTRSFYDIARREAAIRPNWAGVILSGHDGRLIFRSNAPYASDEGRTVDEASLQRSLVVGEPVVGDILTGPLGRQAFAVRWPVMIDGQLRYVLTAAVRPDRILEVLAKQQAPPGWVIGVFDSALSRVARTRDHASVKPSPTLRAMLQNNPSASGSGLTRTLEGDQVYTGFTRLPDSRWTVVVGAPSAPIRAALLSSVAWYLIGALASVLASLLLARRIARQITSGIAGVRDQAVALGEGHAMAPPASDIAEVDQMAHALQAAAQRLHQASEDIRQALGQARAAAQAKDHFLAVLGHELRNPLSPMLTALHLMDLKAGDQLLRERQVLRRQVDHMRRLVDDLLDISRITQGRMELRLQPLNLSALVERAAEGVQPSVDLRGQAIAVQLPGAPVWVNGDETRLVQAITNLLVNALRFCPAGKVTVALRQVPGPDRQAELRISDEGDGMDPQTLAHLFEPFYQAPQPLERARGGLGLGLAIVRSIVELHGGSITAASDGPGSGAQFTITLPTLPAPAVNEQAGAGTAAAGAGRVLLVDDKADALDTLAEVLRVAGYVVQAVAHPREAIALIDSFRPDVAILDIGLPEMDGYELAQALRASAPGWQGRLIALTGFGQHGDKQRASAAGFERHFTKPADPAELLNALAELMGERQVAG
jgi:signal transduction histidine kinase/ActR/RegA family two-component response regulator